MESPLRECPVCEWRPADAEDRSTRSLAHSIHDHASQVHPEEYREFPPHPLSAEWSPPQP